MDPIESSTLDVINQVLSQGGITEIKSIKEVGTVPVLTVRAEAFRVATPCAFILTLDCEDLSAEWEIREL